MTNIDPKILREMLASLDRQREAVLVLISENQVGSVPAATSPNFGGWVSRWQTYIQSMPKGEFTVAPIARELIKVPEVRRRFKTHRAVAANISASLARETFRRSVSVTREKRPGVRGWVYIKA